MTPYVGCRKMRDQNKLKSTIHGVGCSTTTLHLLALLRGVVNFLLKKKKPLYFPPPYSPDLVPSHFFLLLRLTKGIKEGNMMRSPRVTNNLETPVKCQTTHFTKCEMSNYALHKMLLSVEQLLGWLCQVPRSQL